MNDRIAHGYFLAKNYIIRRGYSAEIDWQENLDFDYITEQKLLEEFAWVVIASGMNDKVVRKIFPLIKEIMFNFKSAEDILKERRECLRKSLKVFNHSKKIEAIFSPAEYISNNSFRVLKQKIYEEGVDFIQLFPYMGKATSFHLAKNIGLNVAKPDRHLIRISNVLGYDNPETLCQDLSNKIDEKKSLIDLVLWRYATLDRNYVANINRFIGRLE